MGVDLVAANAQQQQQPNTSTAVVVDVFRNYEDSKRHNSVEKHYRDMRTNQTLGYVLRMKERFSRLDNAEMTIWEAFDALADFVDASDPDTEHPNYVHMLQTAESLRASGAPDWLQLTGLIHDLGKLIYRFGNGAVDGQDGSAGDQWGIAGDTFLVGCALPSSLVFPQFNSLNPDMANPAHNTPTGIYEKHCGLHNTHCAFGHDEYLFTVLSNHTACTLPKDALSIIRFHSMYTWHHGGAYQDLMNEEDSHMLEVVREFQRHDLYTKHDDDDDDEHDGGGGVGMPVWGDESDAGSLRAYYGVLVEKYVPGKLRW